MIGLKQIKPQWKYSVFYGILWAFDLIGKEFLL